ncbi:MAG: hypothetical protein K6G45_11155 [Lachnospiraceae bacterium]|nr:hypothetical protein [Lachnospiraceae bacterium]
MKNFVKSIKMLRYGLQVKMQLILTLAFLVLGIVFELTMSRVDSGSIISGLYLAISGVYVFQLMMSSSVSTLVQTSSLKRGLQTVHPVIFTTLTTLLTYTIFVCIRVVRINKMGGKDFDESSLNASKGIIAVGLMAALLLVYMGICYKLFIVSIVILCIGVVAIMLMGNISLVSRVFDFANDMSLTSIIALGYGCIIVGGLLCRLFMGLLYRRSIDMLAVRTALRQASLK